MSAPDVPSCREQLIRYVLGTLLPRVRPRNMADTLALYRARATTILEAEMEIQGQPLENAAALNLVVLKGPPGSDDTFGVRRNFLVLAVLGTVRRTGKTADADIDAALADLGPAIQQEFEADPTLGGLAVWVEETEVDQDPPITGAARVAEVFVTVQIEYWTVPGDQYAFFYAVPAP
ncbi:hypothetical protein [Nitrospirillum bahiense]|uniref:Uncharacterized protein n=1 Tax=Nitrospirillum amazonense TaxID=28077 RepID=A0A560F1V4_9PROT|nr:hypothetical protein [Nitrospirillum amazonense]TWB15599.1 hypothetical protein FBZ88_12952 [Nitrospirillum amazonense]